MPANSDELGIDHFGLGILGLTYEEARAEFARATMVGPPSVCVHRGEEIRRIRCDACTDKTTWLKVLACGIYSECTAGKSVDGIQCCLKCPDFTTAVENRDPPAVK